MCTFGVLGLSCETLAALVRGPTHPVGARGASQPGNSKRAHFRDPAFKNTTKFQREDLQERVAGEGKKNEILGGPAEGGPGLGVWGKKVRGKVVANFGQVGLGSRCFEFECSGFDLRMRCAGAKNEDGEFEKTEKEKTLVVRPNSISANSISAG